MGKDGAPLVPKRDEVSSIKLLHVLDTDLVLSCHVLHA